MLNALNYKTITSGYTDRPGDTYLQGLLKARVSCGADGVAPAVCTCQLLQGVDGFIKSRDGQHCRQGSGIHGWKEDQTVLIPSYFVT